MHKLALNVKSGSKIAVNQLQVVVLLFLILTSSSATTMSESFVDRDDVSAPPLPSFGVYRYHGARRPDLTLTWLQAKPCSGENGVCADCHVNIGNDETTLQGLKLKRGSFAEIGLNDYHLRNCYQLVRGKQQTSDEMYDTILLAFVGSRPQICVERDSRDEDGDYTAAMFRSGQKGNVARYVEALVLDKKSQRYAMSSARQQSSGLPAAGESLERTRATKGSEQRLVMEDHSFARSPDEEPSDEPLDPSMKTSYRDSPAAGQSLETPDRLEHANRQDEGPLETGSRKRRAENELEIRRPLKKRFSARQSP